MATPHTSDTEFSRHAVGLPFDTPFLVMSREQLDARAAEYARYADRVGTFYAVKANADPDVLALLAAHGLGFEISSQAELAVLAALGVDQANIISSNPIKSPAFIRAMRDRGTRQLVVDSTTEVEKIAALVPECEVLVRLLVDNTGSDWPLDKKFGVPIEEAVELLAFAASRGLTPAGVTFHVGSQCKSLDSWRSALEDALAVWNGASANHALRVLNIGGGFPAGHEEQWLQPGTIMDFVIDQVELTFPAGVELVAEPGRGLVADAGMLVTAVIGKAVRDGNQWVYVDVGVFNGLMEVIGGIGYKYRSVRDEPSQSCTIAGPSCDSMDVIAEGVMLPDLQVGDRVAIYPAGAYTTAYAAPFNGAVVPNVVLT